MWTTLHHIQFVGWEEGSPSFCPCWSWTMILLTSSSWAAEITEEIWFLNLLLTILKWWWMCPCSLRQNSSNNFGVYFHLLDKVKILNLLYLKILSSLLVLFGFLIKFFWSLDPMINLNKMTLEKWIFISDCTFIVIF